MTLAAIEKIFQLLAKPSIVLRGLLLFPALLSLALATGCSTGSVKAATEDPQTVVEAMLQTEQTAWNANDSVTYASVYRADADFINIRGQIFTGTPAITALHAKIFAGPFKGSNIVISVRLFTLLAPGVAMVDTQQVVTNFVGLPPGIVPTSTGTLVTYFKYVAEQQPDGGWKFISGQNTAALPAPPAA